MKREVFHLLKYFIVCFFIPFFAFTLPDKDSFLAAVKKGSPKWMVNQIKHDFKPFKNGISSEMIDNLYLTLDPYAMLLVRFNIIDNQVYCDNTNDWSGRSSIIIEALQFFTETVGLPNLDFVVSMHDGVDQSLCPDVAISSKIEGRSPLLVFAKTVNSRGAILIPDFSALSDSYRFNYTYQRLYAFPWEKKEEKAFWRGSSTGGMLKKENCFLIPRTQITLLSLLRPDLVDAKFSQLLQCTAEAEKMLKSYDLVDRHLSIDEHLPYKYLIDIDGNSCTYDRCYWILMSNSLMLKQESDNIQWYYSGIIPYKHYLPLKENCSDVFEQIEWAKNHDEEAKNMALRSTKFVQENLNIENIYLYFYKVLMKYAEFQKNDWEKDKSKEI